MIRSLTVAVPCNGKMNVDFEPGNNGKRVRGNRGFINYKNLLRRTEDRDWRD